MNRGRIIALCIVGAIIVAGSLPYILLKSEPAYQGRPVSYWFDQFNTTNRSQAANALREIGPAAVPFLLKKARCKDGDTLYDKLYRTIYYKAPNGWKSHMSLPKPFDNTFHYRVASALQLLGPAALPQLIKGMANDNSNVRLTALRAATLIGPNPDSAVPAFTRLINDPNGSIRCEAIIALNRMGSKKKLALAELIGALNDSDVYVRAAAALVLGELGAEAKSALPALTNVLSATNSYTRVQAAIAIWRIAGDTNMIPALIAELDKTPEAHTCSWILSAFGEMGPAAKPAVPAILRKIRDSRGVSNVPGIDISSVGLGALKKIEPEAAARAGLK